MSDLTIRPARSSDAADLAILENIASHGLACWLWQGAVNRGKAEDAYEWGRSRFLNTEDDVSFEQALVAEDHAGVQGCIVSYMMPELDADNLIPDIANLMALFANSSGDWFIDSLAVYPSHRGMGLGRTLMEASQAQAQREGADHISLVVEDSNENALSLYHKLGFVEIGRRPCDKLPGNTKTENWLRLRAAVK